MSETIGRYQVLARLGPGRLGIVCQAFDPEHRRRVALRLVRLAPGDALTPDDRLEALRTAVRAAQTLDHPNIATVHEQAETEIAARPGSAGEAIRVLYVASALVDGKTLADRLSESTSVDPATACRWLTKILLALDHAHGRGVVHGALNPSNVFVTAADDIVLTDFGLGRADAARDSKLSTPDYLAPEQMLGEAGDARCDLFAAGVLLYQLLCGRLPYQGGAATVIGQALAQDPLPPSTQQPALGMAFDSVVARALARQREHRFGSADEFLQALNRATFAASTPVVDDDATVIVPTAAAVSPRAPEPARAVEAPVPQAAAVSVAEAPGPSPAVDQATLQMVILRLADDLGPMARIVVNRTVGQATSRTEFFRLLAAWIPAAAQRQSFLREFGVGE